MSDILGDFRYALRAFRRNPAYALVTVLILGIGIGAVTLMFSALNASVLRPLPYPDPEELVWGWKANENLRENSLSFDDYLDYRNGVQAFESLGAFYVFNPQVLVTGTEEAERISSSLVTPNFFSTLGVGPMMGRSFRPEEAVEGGPDVAILSHAYWQGRLGGEPDIVGQTLTLDGRPTEVVGVMPQGFSFSRPVQLWLPARAGAGYTQGRGNNNFFMVGRLREDVTLRQAQAQMETVTLGIQEINPDFASWYHWLQPLHEVFFGDMRSVLLLLMAIVSLVPLVACANVASLSLARASTRNQELATRLALGAERGRIIRQLLAESLLLAVAGGALGLLLAHGGGGLLRSLGPATLPRLEEIGVDRTVVTFGLLASLLAVTLFGILPALRSTGFNISDALRFGGARGGSEGRIRSRSVLVVAQVAFSVILMVASGLLFRSLLQLQRVDPGFQVEGLLTAGLQLPAFKYQDDPQALGVAWDQVLARISGVPGVVGAAGADWLPVTPGGGPWNGLSRPDRPLPGDAPYIEGRRKFVSPDYFQVLETPLLAGRSFDANDRTDSEPVMVLSEALAEALFPEEDPLGQPVTLWGQPFQVIGVTASVDEAGLGVEGRPVFFLSTGQYPQPGLRIMARTAGPDPLLVTGALRNVLNELDPDIALSGIQTMDARVQGSVAQPRFRTYLVGAFALVGLILSAFGLYGVLAYLVTQRHREIGIRVAVGAGNREIVGLVVGQGMRMVGGGVILGLLGGAIVATVLKGLLYDVAPADPLTFAGVSVLLVAVALLASLLPALRALKVDPLESLRAE
ncbi:ABC transporter permease [Gemmatimonadota bacterium]